MVPGFYLKYVCHFWVQNVKLVKIWPRQVNGLEKTNLEPNFGVSSSKNKNFDQQCNYQKVWKIALSKREKYSGSPALICLLNRTANSAQFEWNLAGLAGRQILKGSQGLFSRSYFNFIYFFRCEAIASIFLAYHFWPRWCVMFWAHFWLRSDFHYMRM